MTDELKKPNLPARGATKKPNVLFILFDDLNTNLGCYGDGFVRSPSLDHLATEGLLFSRAYCQQALCSPSRTSMLTGKRPDTLGIWDIPTHFREKYPDIVTLPQWFKSHGYFTQDIGKIYHNWDQNIHGDPDSWSVPAVMHWDRHDTEKPKIDPRELPPNLAQDYMCECRDVPDEAYFDGRIADLAIKALRDLAKKDKPFFLGVGFWKPHSPFNPPKKYWDLYERVRVPDPLCPNGPIGAPEIAYHINHEFLGIPPRQVSPEIVQELRHGYYASISYTDAQAGKVIDEVDRLGLRDNTVVVLLSDQGLHVGERRLWGKMSNFELDARTPLIIRVPWLTKTGSTTKSLVELLDLYPTLAELCGLPKPPHVEGESLIPVLKNPTTVLRPAALTQNPRPPLYWKLGFNGAPGASDPQVMGYSIRADRWRYTEWRIRKTDQIIAQELYDHEADPGETVNKSGTIESVSVIPELALLMRQLLDGK